MRHSIAKKIKGNLVKLQTVVIKRNKASANIKESITSISKSVAYSNVKQVSGNVAEGKLPE